MTHNKKRERENNDNEMEVPAETNLKMYCWGKDNKLFRDIFMFLPL